MSAVNLTVTQNTKHPENSLDHHQNENGQFLSAHGRVPGLRGAASLAKIYAITGGFLRTQRKLQTDHRPGLINCRPVGPAEISHSLGPTLPAKHQTRYDLRWLHMRYKQIFSSLTFLDLR